MAKDEPDDAARVDAHEACGKLVCRGGDNRLAEQGAIDEDPQQHDNDDGAGEHHQALRQNGRAPEANGIVAEPGRQAVEALVEHHLRGAAQENRGADGDDDEHDGAGSACRLDREAVEREPHDNCKDDRKARRQRQRHAGQPEEHRRHSAQHHELALGEVDDVGGVVDQGEAERDQGIDRADGQAGEGELQKFRHFESDRA